MSLEDEINGNEVMWDATSLTRNPRLLLNDLISDGWVSVEELEEHLSHVKTSKTVWVICCGTSRCNEGEMTGSVHGVFHSFEEGMDAMKAIAQSDLGSDLGYEEVGNPGRDDVIYLSDRTGRGHAAQWKSYTLKQPFYNGDGGNVYISLCQSSYKSDCDCPWTNHISIGIFDELGDAEKWCKYTKRKNRWYCFEEDENGHCFMDCAVYQSNIPPRPACDESGNVEN